MKDIDIIKTGMLNEVEGVEFYTLAANNASDPDVSKAFLDLADEEKLHFNYLQKLASDMEAGVDTDLTFEETPSPNIFRWNKRTHEKPSLPVTVFGIARNMEEKSVRFYEDAAIKAESESSKKLLLYLAEWEKVHFEEFSELYDFYKGQWWDSQGFFPMD